MHEGKIRVTTKSTRKPKPSDILDFIQESCCIRGDSVEDDIISMLPDTPHSRQPNQATSTTGTFFQTNQVTKQQKVVPTSSPCINIFSYPIGNFIPYSFTKLASEEEMATVLNMLRAKHTEQVIRIEQNTSMV
jgi:hypothetical protein